MEPERGTLIEGIGDELIHGIFLLIVLVLPFIGFIYAWVTQRIRQTQIDPASQDTVNSVRQEINDQQQRTSARTMRRREEELTCPVCLNDATYAIQTNCGHTFCGRCMITYWQHGNWIRGLKCPVCRTQVNIMLRYFTTEEQTTSTAEREEVISQVNTYNRRYSGDPIPWVDYIRDLPTLLRHLISEIFSLSGMVLMFRMRVLVLFFAAILYFLSPLDIIPEAMFGILGFLDDLFVLLLLAVYVSILYRQFIVQRAANEVHAE